MDTSAQLLIPQMNNKVSFGSSCLHRWEQVDKTRFQCRNCDAERNDELDDLLYEIESLTRERDRLKEELGSSELLLDGAKAKVAELREELANAEKRIDVLCRTISKQEKQLDHYKRVIEDAQAKCEQYWNEHDVPDAEFHAVLEWIHRNLESGGE